MQQIVNELSHQERECTHRPLGMDGEFYSGQTYLKHLQRLRGDEAMKVANRVSPFFWADAKEITVWLCQDCASHLGLR
jgi:hypothetical protein